MAMASATGRGVAAADQVALTKRFTGTSLTVTEQRAVEARHDICAGGVSKRACLVHCQQTHLPQCP